MSYTVENSSLLGDLERVAKTRQEIARRLSKIADTIAQAELAGETASGRLGLAAEVAKINLASESLRQGVFRLLVLGDLKRGKSTLLNALIGEKLLPSDVNPCTALLTVLRYGINKKVTVHFKDNRDAVKLDLASFKEKYTIDPDEAKKLEEESKLAFPEVSHAVIEYPLPLLERGIEIIDSPGLNDTEARNELSLSYINNCHAILFVFRASQPYTLEERRYLENYLKGRGLTVFFLINGWDEVRDSLIDPDNPEDLAAAESRLRQVFSSNLGEYCEADGQNFYAKRVFEVSAINALRRRIKNPDDNLVGTGFPEFTQALNYFLTQKRAVAEIHQAKTLAGQVYHRVREALARRIPLLDQDLAELQQRMNAVAPEFEQLGEIRDRFQDEIRQTRDKKAQAIADGFRTYILNLGNTFAADFSPYQPNISFFESLERGKREEFNAAFKRGFEQYINDKIAAWELTAEREIAAAFGELARSAAVHGAAYAQVSQTIGEKLIGQQVKTGINIGVEQSSPNWASWAVGFVSLAWGNVAGIALAGAGFDWKNIFVNALAVLGIWSFLSIFSLSLIGGPLGVFVLGLGVGAWQVETARQELIALTKKEFIKYLPQVAQEQWQPIFEAVKGCFDNYEREVIKQINDDIKSRQAELNNLVEQKQSREIDREAELQRLQNLEAEIAAELRAIDVL